MNDDRIRKLEDEVRRLQGLVESRDKRGGLAIILFSGEWDRFFAAFTLANGALALDMEVNIFLTFWGAAAARNGCHARGRDMDAFQKTFSRMLPRVADQAPLSKFHFFGLGKWALRRLMKKKGVTGLPELVQSAIDMGAKIHFCDTSLQLFGWCPEDLLGGDRSNWCGVSTFLSIANRSQTVLFI